MTAEHDDTRPADSYQVAVYDIHNECADKLYLMAVVNELTELNERRTCVILEVSGLDQCVSFTDTFRVKLKLTTCI